MVRLDTTGVELWVGVVGDTAGEGGTSTWGRHTVNRGGRRRGRCGWPKWSDTRRAIKFAQCLCQSVAVSAGCSIHTYAIYLSTAVLFSLCQHAAPDRCSTCTLQSTLRCRCPLIHCRLHRRRRGCIRFLCLLALHLLVRPSLLGCHLLQRLIQRLLAMRLRL